MPNGPWEVSVVMFVEKLPYSRTFQVGKTCSCLRSLPSGLVGLYSRKIEKSFIIRRYVLVNGNLDLFGSAGGDVLSRRQATDGMEGVLI